MASSYDIGDRVRCTGNFTDLDGDPADPTDVVAKVKEPDGTITEYLEADLEHPETGEFYIDFDVEMDGIHSYRFEGLGTLISAEETWFYVVRSAFTVTGS